MTTNWLFWIGGGLLGLAGLWLCYWALIADRAKGRKRCPKCWYNMQAAENLRCPECGKTVKTERKLFKTHRRWRWAFVSIFLLLGSYTLEVTPRYRKSDWRENSSTSLLVLHAYLFDDSESFGTVQGRSGASYGYGSGLHFSNEELLADWQWRVMMSYVLRQLRKSPNGVTGFQMYYFLNGGPPFTGLATEYISSLLAESTDDEATAIINSMFYYSISLRALSPSEIEEWINCLIDALARVDPHSKQIIVFTLKEYGYESIIAVPKLLELLHEEDDDLRELVAQTFGHLGENPNSVWETIVWQESEDDKDEPVYRVPITSLLSRVGTKHEEITNALIDVIKSDDVEEVQLAAAISLCQLDAGSPLAHSIIIDHLTRPDGPQKSIIWDLHYVSSESQFLLPGLEHITNNPQEFSSAALWHAGRMKERILGNYSD